jgi:diguanylate cyclase (GGDEF)-like protein
VPLLIEGRLCGTFALYQDISERRRSELALEQTRAELAAKVGELEQMNLRARRLNELAELLQSCHNTAEAYTIISQRMRQFFPDEAGALAVVSASRNMVEMVSSWGEPPRCERVFAPADCWALRRGQPHRVDDLATDPVCPHVPQPGAGSYLCVPMTAQGEALGILHLQWELTDAVPSGAQNPREDRIQLAIALGEHLGLALANMRLRESLRAQSIRDPLTGLFNRRYLEESLERELRRAIRKQRPLGAVLFDLDHFKQFNDTFGHAAGDALLAELGRFLQTRIRADDIACRYGGEEFVLILPESSLQETTERVDGLRLEFEHLHVEHRGLALGPVTLSAGVAVFPEHGTTAETLLRQADRALYRAKELGRNRVVVAESLETGAVLERER